MKGLFYFARRKMCLPNSVESSEGGSSIVIDPCSSLHLQSLKEGIRLRTAFLWGKRVDQIYLMGPSLAYQGIFAITMFKIHGAIRRTSSVHARLRSGCVLQLCKKIGHFLGKWFVVKTYKTKDFRSLSL